MVRGEFWVESGEGNGVWLIMEVENDGGDRGSSAPFGTLYG